MDLSTPFHDKDNTPVSLLDIMVYSYGSTLYKEVVVGYTKTKLKLIYYPLLKCLLDSDVLFSKARALSGSKLSYRGLIVGKFREFAPAGRINKIHHPELRELLLKAQKEVY